MDDQNKTNGKIILLEDELFVRELYERVLRAEFELLSAEDGEKGLALIQQEASSGVKPNLILLDIMMPKLNGLEVLKKIKQDPMTRDIPVIMLTNLGQDDVIKEASGLGAAGYLIKIRLTPATVLQHVKDFLQNPSQRVEP
jgi:CheY-like chemotaxis protein